MCLWWTRWFRFYWKDVVWVLLYPKNMLIVSGDGKQAGSLSWIMIIKYWNMIWLSHSNLLEPARLIDQHYIEVRSRHTHCTDEKRFTASMVRHHPCDTFSATVISDAWKLGVRGRQVIYNCAMWKISVDNYHVSLGVMKGATAENYHNSHWTSLVCSNKSAHTVRMLVVRIMQQLKVPRDINVICVEILCLHNFAMVTLTCSWNASVTICSDIDRDGCQRMIRLISE